MAMIMPLFEQAAALEQGGKVKPGDTDAVFAQWVEAAPASRRKALHGVVVDPCL